MSTERSAQMPIGPTTEEALQALPPRRHGVQAQRMAAEQRDGELRLPVCADCGSVCYPLRELCVNCLSDRLTWQPVPVGGTLLAETTVSHSNEPWFRAQLPLRIGSVQLDAGSVVAIVFLEGDGFVPGARVRLGCRLDPGGAAVLVARAGP